MVKNAQRRTTIAVGSMAMVVLLGSFSGHVNAQQTAGSVAVNSALPDAPGSADMTGSDPSPQAASAIISGTVLDTNGSVIQDAQVVLSRGNGTDRRVTQSGANGQFTFPELPPGTFRLIVTGKGMGTYVSPDIPLHAGESYIVTNVVVPIVATTDVTVYGNKEELAQEQVHIAIGQRALGVFPNFYTTYDWNAPPMGARQKFHLALRSAIDPLTFAAVAGIAGAEQHHGTFPAFGGGLEGYGKRYGAAYANSFTGKMLGRAVFPSLFHEDPRYFYKGRGSIQSRALYAIAATVMAKNDNGRWMPNYSQVLGNFVAGSVSNLYYPENSRGVALVLNTGLIDTGLNAADNLIREFVLKGITSHVPRNVNENP